MATKDKDQQYVTKEGFKTVGKFVGYASIITLPFVLALAYFSSRRR